MRLKSVGNVEPGSDLGTCVVERRDGRAHVVRSDRRIAVSRELLAWATEDDLPEVAIDGPFLGFCGTHGYRATGEVDEHDNPIYELMTEPA